MGKTLILIADGHRAKILEKNGLKLQQIGPDYERPDMIGKYDKGAAKPGQMCSVKGGKSITPARSHVYAPHTVLGEKEQESFLRKVANELNSSSADLESLVLIAPPNALGELRKLLNSHVLAKVEHEVAKDLTKAREDEILKYVKKPYR